jgi:hypothetical protein
MKQFILGAILSAGLVGVYAHNNTKPNTASPKLVAISQTQSSEDFAPPVKRSIKASDQCHPKGTQYYRMTKYFKGYNSMEDCIKDGGRYPGTGKS